MAASNVFVDTAGFLSLWDASDEQHSRAVAVQAELVRKRRRFVTTDYVVDETATLLLVRHSHSAAVDFLRTASASSHLRVEWMDSNRFRDAVEFFSRHDDKEWSFTDCVSFSLMRELGIRESFTTDHHFRQAGFELLLPR